MIIQKKIPQNNEKFFLGIFVVYGSLDRINAVTRSKQINKKWQIDALFLQHQKETPK